jgi:hypothetical protein
MKILSSIFKIINPPNANHKHKAGFSEKLASYKIIRRHKNLRHGLILLIGIIAFAPVHAKSCQPWDVNCWMIKGGEAIVNETEDAILAAAREKLPKTSGHRIDQLFDKLKWGSNEDRNNLIDGDMLNYINSAAVPGSELNKQIFKSYTLLIPVEQNVLPINTFSQNDTQNPYVTSQAATPNGTTSNGNNDVDKNTRTQFNFAAPMGIKFDYIFQKKPTEKKFSVKIGFPMYQFADEITRKIQKQWNIGDNKGVFYVTVAGEYEFKKEAKLFGKDFEKGASGELAGLLRCSTNNGSCEMLNINLWLSGQFNFEGLYSAGQGIKNLLDFFNLKVSRLGGTAAEIQKGLASGMADLEESFANTLDDVELTSWSTNTTDGAAVSLANNFTIPPFMGEGGETPVTPFRGEGGEPPVTAPPNTNTPPAKIKSKLNTFCDNDNQHGGKYFKCFLDKQKTAVQLGLTWDIDGESKITDIAPNFASLRFLVESQAGIEWEILKDKIKLILRFNPAMSYSIIKPLEVENYNPFYTNTD